MPTVRTCGERALLVELSDTAEVLACHGALRAAGLPGIVDVVPAARTVLVTVADPAAREPTRAQLAALRWSPGTGDPGSATDTPAEVTLDVRYDGPDLQDVARHTGLSVAEVVERHTGTPLRVGFGGFAPGFAYLIEGDARLAVPRRDEPRTRVPAGSVGLAGEFSGVYPRESPGGWQLIGRTDAVLFDVDRDPPALLTPGIRVRFRAVR